MLLPLPTGVCLLRMIDVRLEVTLHRSRAAGRIGLQAPARLPRQLGRFLHRLHRAICGRLEATRPLPPAPSHERGPVFVVMAPTGLAWRAAPPGAAPQGLFPTGCGLTLLPGGVLEVLGFHRACQRAVGFLGEGRMTSPPTPAIARTPMDSSRPGHAPRRTRQAQQEGGEKPVGQRPRALGPQGSGAVVDGALAAVAPVAFASRPGGIRAPGSTSELWPRGHGHGRSCHRKAWREGWQVSLLHSWCTCERAAWRRTASGRGIGAETTSEILLLEQGLTPLQSPIN